MKKLKSLSILALLCIATSACKGNDTLKKENSNVKTSTPITNKVPAVETTGIPFIVTPRALPEPISQFVRRIFQDSKGNMWLGTNGDGVLFYDGKSVSYHSVAEGFDGYTVRGIVEDKNGFVWLGTENGLIKYDPNVSSTPTPDSFSKYAQKDGLPNDDIWSLMIDSKELLWISTYKGVASFDGARFTIFPLPASKNDPNRGVSDPKIVSSVFEDSKGNIWFGTPGGAYKYNGEKLQHISEAEGLAGSSVNHILEDNNGDFWFATFYNGVSRYDSETFTNYTKDGIITGDEVWSLFKDKEGNIWFPAEHHGVYKYDGKKFTNYGKAQGLNTAAIQCIYEDTDGVLWFGGYLGLFRLNGDQVVPVTKADLEG